MTPASLARLTVDADLPPVIRADAMCRQAADRIEALERQIAAADKLAEALEPFAASLERYSGFTEYALFGIWEDVNGAAGRKLNILRKENFDEARAALDAYQSTKEQNDG